MTTGVNSYGTAAEVAAYTKRYTSAGAYGAGTRPTLTEVEGWIDSVSATMNTALAGAGFSIPITQTDAKAAIAAFVVEAVVDLCHAANSAGRFFTDQALARGITPMRAIRSEMKAWVDENAAGLEALGATRTLEDQRANALTAGYLTIDIAEHEDGTSTVGRYKHRG